MRNLKSNRHFYEPFSSKRVRAQHFKEREITIYEQNTAHKKN